MKTVSLAGLNSMSLPEQAEILSWCNGSSGWVRSMLSRLPAKDMRQLLDDAGEVWRACGPEDWKEAFLHHPRIGDINSLREKFGATRQWASGEQAGVGGAAEDVLEALAEGNRLYEQRFGYIFIVCATGRTAEEMLALLRVRLKNDPEEELLVAMGEQEKITRIRLEKLII